MLVYLLAAFLVQAFTTWSSLMSIYLVAVFNTGEAVLDDCYRDSINPLVNLFLLNLRSEPTNFLPAVALHALFRFFTSFKKTLRLILVTTAQFPKLE